MRTACLPLSIIALLGCATARPPAPPAQPVAPDPPPAVLLLTPANEGLTKEGLWRENMALADINGDGFVDIITPPTRGESAQPNIFLGDGTGRWMEWAEARFPRLPLAYGGVAVGDLDGDGLQDIVLACHEGRIYALFQVRSGEFESRSDGMPDPTLFSSRAVILADFDGDGRPEIAALNESPTYLNVSKLNLIRQKVLGFDGTKWTEWSVTGGKGENMAFGNSLVAGDFNGDGRPDFATCSNVFNFKHTLFINEAGGFRPSAIPALPDRAYMFYVDAADFDGDGRTDLVYTAMTFPVDEEDVNARSAGVFAKVFLVLNRPGGWEYLEVDSREVTKSKMRFRGLAVADFDQNGRPDVATVFDDRTLQVYLNLDGRTFKPAGVEGWIPQARASWLGAADFDGDGGPDLAAAYGMEKDGGRFHAYKIKVK